MELRQNCADGIARMECPATIKSSLRVLEGKWKITIINELMSSQSGPLRFSELERQVQGVTQKVLIQQLKELERDGVILRTLYPQVPPKVEYSLTELGVALRPAMNALIDWAQTRVGVGTQVSGVAENV